MSLPSTWLLRRLRRAIADAPDEAAAPAFSPLPAAWTPRVRALRAAFRAAAAGEATAADAEAAFLDAWRAFSLLPAAHALHLRAPFESAALRALLAGEAAMLLTLERAHADCGPGVLGSGHRVLGGALGAG